MPAADAAHAPLCFPFPEGTPFLSGNTGTYVNKPHHLPVRHLFGDFDVFWVRRGTARWTLSRGDTIRAPRHEIVVLPPYTPAEVVDVEPDLVFNFCHINVRAVPASETARRDAAVPGAETGAHLPLHFSARQAPRVVRAYAALEKTVANVKTARGSPWRIERAVIGLWASLAHFAVAYARRNPRPRWLEVDGAVRPDARIARLKARIDADPAQPWSVADLAAELDLSPGHLHALATATLGRSLKRYIVEARLKRALQRLRARPGGVAPSVREVSEACGFASQHFFTRQFKAYFGLTPVQVRNGMPIEV